jgi:hypothetical protein
VTRKKSSSAAHSTGSSRSGSRTPPLRSMKSPTLCSFPFHRRIVPSHSADDGKIGTTGPTVTHPSVMVSSPSRARLHQSVADCQVGGRQDACYGRARRRGVIAGVREHPVSSTRQVEIAKDASNSCLPLQHPFSLHVLGSRAELDWSACEADQGKPISTRALTWRPVAGIVPGCLHRLRPSSWGFSVVYSRLQRR